jgi:hypothetical protein
VLSSVEPDLCKRRGHGEPEGLGPVSCVHSHRRRSRSPGKGTCRQPCATSTNVEYGRHIFGGLDTGQESILCASFGCYLQKKRYQSKKYFNIFYYF